MNGRRAIVGVCCALLASAFVAQSASAISGTTAFTCVKDGGDKSLRGDHCLTTGTAPQEYGHVAIAQDKTTELIATNVKTANSTTESSVIKLKLTIAGVPIELNATEINGAGWMENKKTASGEHYTVNEGTITFTGVTVKEPGGKGCKVFTHKEDGSGDPGEEGAEGTIHTRPLKGTTEGQGDNFKYQAADGGAYANFWLTCTTKVPTIEGTWSVAGSVRAQPVGATSTLTHAATTTENTLKCRGTKAGVEGQLTILARENNKQAYTPVAQTTVTT
ncbi:MAG TPA: hypothetical protein VF081_08820 [Solirubrobacterales bacterium]